MAKNPFTKIIALLLLLAMMLTLAVSCGETPINSFTCSGWLIILYPPTKASPSVGLVRPVSILIIVVLPAPLTPSKENNSPCLISKSTLLTATIFLYLLVSCIVLIAFNFLPPNLFKYILSNLKAKM